MTALRVVAAIVVALILQSVVARLVGNGQVPVDLVLVSVVSTALLYGRVAGLLGGSLAGLAQDALS
ncbi:MAG: rod shape-determining protein MreD, partial [Acidobacteriota bacterium]